MGGARRSFISPITSLQPSYSLVPSSTAIPGLLMLSLCSVARIHIGACAH